MTNEQQPTTPPDQRQPGSWIAEERDEQGPLARCLRCLVAERMPSDGAPLARAIEERCAFLARHGNAVGCPLPGTAQGGAAC